MAERVEVEATRLNFVSCCARGRAYSGLVRACVTTLSLALPCARGARSLEFRALSSSESLSKTLSEYWIKPRLNGHASQGSRLPRCCCGFVALPFMMA